MVWCVFEADVRHVFCLRGFGTTSGTWLKFVWMSLGRYLANLMTVKCECMKVIRGQWEDRGEEVGLVQQRH
jgi:hypothetical protein